MLDTRATGGFTRRSALLAGLMVPVKSPALQVSRRTRALDQLLQAAVDRGDVAGVVAMVASSDSVLYTGATGMREASTAQAMRADTVFRIYSMTKPITSVAAMQLVEQEKLRLEDSVATYVPSVAEAQVLTEAGELRKPKTPVTVRHLLTHTSGFAYPFWSKRLREYTRERPANAPKHILMFDPGENWLYGTSTDLLGQVIESASGASLDAYFGRNIFDPLRMRDTAFNLTPALARRLASSHQRQADGTLREQAARPPSATSSFNGGSGLFGTAADYVAFMRMILEDGALGGTRLLRRRTLAQMKKNQIGGLEAGRFPTAWPELSNDVDFHPGFSDRFGFGFLINPVAYPGRRSRGSLAWAGAANTYFWIDPGKKLCAVLMMQILPFFDGKAVALLSNFEKLVYAQ